MSKISERLNYKKQLEHFYKEQNAKVGDFILKGQDIKHEKGLDALKDYLVDHFVYLQFNTFFPKLSKENQETFSNQLLRHYAIAYGEDFVARVTIETELKINAKQEKKEINEDIIEVMKNKKTETTAEPSKPKGLRV